MVKLRREQNKLLNTKKIDLFNQQMNFLWNEATKDLFNLSTLKTVFYSMSEEEKKQIFNEKDYLGNNYLMMLINILRDDLALEFIDMGFNINLKNHREETPLMLATLRNMDRVFEKLLVKNANVNAVKISNNKEIGSSVLMILCDKGNFSFVEKLLLFNPKIDYVNDLKQNVLFYCFNSQDDNKLKCFSLLAETKKITKKMLLQEDLLSNNLIEVMIKKSNTNMIHSFFEKKLYSNELHSFFEKISYETLDEQAKHNYDFFKKLTDVFNMNSLLEDKKLIKRKKI